MVLKMRLSQDRGSGKQGYCGEVARFSPSCLPLEKKDAFIPFCASWWWEDVWSSWKNLLVLAPTLFPLASEHCSLFRNPAAVGLKLPFGGPVCSVTKANGVKQCGRDMGCSWGAFGPNWEHLEVIQPAAGGRPHHWGGFDELEEALSLQLTLPNG